jgi:hypothetical protein
MAGARHPWHRCKAPMTGGRGPDLAGDGGDDGLRVHQAGVAQVVQAAAAQDLRARLPPHGLAELRARTHLPDQATPPLYCNRLHLAVLPGHSMHSL